MGEYLYSIFISPIENIVEFIFFFMMKIFADSPAVCIIFVSLCVNILILPLYKRADAMQAAERDKVASMERWNKHIRKTFKGDERYMMQSAYYRIEGYKPFYAITGSLSLLFQIPFFIAAYHFLSTLTILEGAEFLLIQDLGAEDGILKLGSVSINILPVLMTLINIVSGAIYTKGFKLKDKLQLYIMALLFLVVLYKSPSGLVLYWTCNNLFSLGKNVFAKLGDKKRPTLNAVSALFGTILFFYLIVSNRFTVKRQFFEFGLIMLISYIPLFLSYYKKMNWKFLSVLSKNACINDKERKTLTRMFISGAVLCTVFYGILIPSGLVLSSPVELGTLVHSSPLELVLNSFFVYFGFFIVWLGIFYAISRESFRRVFAKALFVLPIASIVNYYGFYGKFGTMDELLKFVASPSFNKLTMLINLLAVILVILAFLFIAKKWPRFSCSILTILIISAVALSAVNIYKTDASLKEQGYYESKKDTTISATVPLSKNGKNVIVIMLDRAAGEYAPYIFKELPEVAANFKDFVYYPNTISFGGCTNFAAPSLFGGYEYIPSEMNKRDEELLVDKTNEALLVLPAIFSENGYEVSVVDPVYSNYQEYPDVSIYNDYENVTGYVSKWKYADYVYHNDEEKTAQKKHVVTYSLFRSAPVFLQKYIYDDGFYLSNSGTKGAITDFVYCAEAYATLDYLDEYTYIVNDSTDRLVLMANYLTHEPSYLQLPNYDIVGETYEGWPYSEERLDIYNINGRILKMDNLDSVMHYHVNAAAYKLLGEFFKYLQDIGVYDNTRIIIVSDHSWPLNQLDNVMITYSVSIETYNPILLVKDFADSDALNQGEIKYLEEANLYYCETLMSNADVPTLATTGTIDNPVNPFTGKEINNSYKTENPLYITASGYSSILDNNGTVFRTDDQPWLEFTGQDVHDMNNWTILE